MNKFVGIMFFQVIELAEDDSNNFSVLFYGEEWLKICFWNRRMLALLVLDHWIFMNGSVWMLLLITADIIFLFKTFFCLKLYILIWINIFLFKTEKNLSLQLDDNQRIFSVKFLNIFLSYFIYLLFLFINYLTFALFLPYGLKKVLIR